MREKEDIPVDRHIAIYSDTLEERWEPHAMVQDFGMHVLEVGRNVLRGYMTPDPYIRKPTI